jgi:hypothetical protein
MLGKRWSRGLIGATVLTLVFAATAVAAGNSLHVQTPTSVKLGTVYKIKTFGHATSPANFVVGFSVKGAKCKSTFLQEYSFLGNPSTAPLAQHVRGSFSKTTKLKAAAGGTVYWCAYLINYKSGKTYAKAFGHYTEHH